MSVNTTISKADVGNAIQKSLNKQNEYNQVIFANSGSGGGGIKGTVATYDSLPASPAAGDMYLISDTKDLVYFADAWRVCLTTVTTLSGSSAEITVSNTLNDNSWAVISEVSQAGNGDLYWDVGDAKEIELNGQIGNCFTATNLSLCVFILDFNHKMNGVDENNIIWSGFKSALTEGKDVAFADSKYNSSITNGTVCFNMNHWGNYNYGGWKGSDLRYDVLGATSTQPSDYGKQHTTSCVGYDATAETLSSPKANTLLAALPSELRNVIRFWTRWIDAVGNNSNVDENIQATVDAITLLSEPEVYTPRGIANQYEQNHNTQMAYYANGNSKVRYKHNALNDSAWWWLSSPISGGSNQFCVVANAGRSGNESNSGAAYAGALAPAFKT